MRSSRVIEVPREDKTMTTKAELVALYTTMVEEGEGDMLHAEISECTRLKELYETRLQYLNDRDPRLALVREGRVDLYEHYADHFFEKIRINTRAAEAAREVLHKWQRELNDSSKSTKNWGVLVSKLLGLP